MTPPHILPTPSCALTALRTGRAWRALRDAGWTAAIVLPCVLLSVVTSRLLGPLALFWPADAVLLGMLLRHPERASAAGWLGASAAYLAADLWSGSDWLRAAWLNAGNLAGVGTGFLVAGRVLPVALRRLDQPRAMLCVLFVCFVSVVVEALIGGSANPVLFGRSLVSGLIDWFNGELATFIILTPLILAAPRGQTLRGLLARCRPPRRWSWHDALPGLSLALSLAGALALGGPGVLALPVPALIWCALRYPVFPTLVLTALLSIAQLFFIAIGVMHLPESNLSSIDAVQSARLGIALVALGPMAVAVVDAARNDLLRQLDHMARYDHLTGMLRRGAFLDSATALLADRIAAGRPVAMLMIDIDHFKRINDRFGHAQGDRVLVVVSTTLQARLRGEDLVGRLGGEDFPILGRLGGEEFAVLLPDTGADGARTVAERLRLSVAALALPEAETAGGTLPALSGLTASFGLAACDAARPHSVETLLAQADAALYVAKAAGRNRVEGGEGDRAGIT
jgi:diguanylate cyclase (GGDEF)-like protein